MDVVDLLTRTGGVATRAQLLAASSRREVDAALESGAVVKLARGRYALPQAEAARAAAHRLTGVLCLTSAAIEHGWPVKHVPAEPHVVVPPNRKLTDRRAAGVELHRFRLGPDDVTGIVTSADRTLSDCLRHLPFDQGLAIADSALRAGYPMPRLRALVRDARGRHAVRMRQVVEVADPCAANPFESVLRSIGLGVPGLRLVPP